jgi:hypothetical protein
MARILIEQQWFDQVEPSTFTEQEFEDRVVLHAPSVYPEYFVLPFKHQVESDFGGSKPDLAFISKDYSEWRVVEVEMGYHDLNSHVEPQVQRLATAKYDVNIADYLLRKEPILNHNSLSKLITKEQPRVLVILNEVKNDWVTPLARHGAITATFELFRSSDEIEIFRVNGEYPEQILSPVSTCSIHPYVNRFIRIHDPDALSLPPRGKLKLRLNNCITEWQRIDTIDAGKGYWLEPLGRNPLTPKHRYAIHRLNDNHLLLKRLDAIKGKSNV